MSDEVSPVRCDDPTTWRHKGEKIDLPRLLQLIDENGGAKGLDLHGCDMGDIDARPEVVRLHLYHYRSQHGQDACPPWLASRLSGITSIDLSGAHLEHARLYVAQLDNANFYYAHLENASLVRANLQNTILEEAHLENASLHYAYLKNASLCNAHLENAGLYYTHLENADLRYAHLETVNLAQARLHGARWDGAHFDRTRIQRHYLGPAIGDELAARGQIEAHHPRTFHTAREAYLALKANFDSIGRYDDASWAYLKEQQMEKAMYFPTTAGHNWIRESMHAAVPPPWRGPHRLPRWLWWKLRSAFHHTRLFLGLCPREVRQEMARGDESLSRWRWARNWAYELLTGYGERPHMPVMWAVVVVLVFALIYAAAGNIASGDGGGTHNFLTALTHSIGAFATIGFNTLEPVGWGARLLTATEAMFGIGLFALFVFTLGNRMRRS